MSALAELWLVSLILSGIALVIMLALVAARWINGRRERSRAVERRRIVPLLLGAGPDADASPGTPALVADVSTDLIQMVRGSEKEEVVDRSSRLGVPQQLRDRLHRGSPRARLAAAEALAHFDDADSVAHLHGALDDPNSDVRLAAALALASGQQPPPVQLLIDKLGIGTHENSMMVVGLFQDIAARRPEEIRALIDGSANAAVKAAAIEALSASGDYSLVPRIAALVVAAPPDAPELPRYLEALGDFGHPAAAPAVRHALESEAWWVRAAAAQTAGRVGINEASQRLADLLSDEYWWVRFRAGEALTRLGAPGLDLLAEAALGGDERASAAARLTLAEHDAR